MRYGRACVERLRGMFSFTSGMPASVFYSGVIGWERNPYFIISAALAFCLCLRSKRCSLITRPAEPIGGADHFLALQYIPAPLTAFAAYENFQPTGLKSVMAALRWGATETPVHPQTPGHPEERPNCWQFLSRPTPRQRCSLGFPQRCVAKKRRRGRHGARNGTSGNVFGRI